MLWSDVFSWRYRVLAEVSTSFTAPAAGQQAVDPSSAVSNLGYHETAWHIDKLGYVYRRYRLPELCLQTLQRIYSLPNIEISEAYAKLRNQIKCQAEAGNPRQAFDVVQAVNMEYFSKAHVADFFRLKAGLYNALGYPDEAYTVLSQSVSVHDNSGSAWAAWGSFCAAQLSAVLQTGPATKWSSPPPLSDASSWLQAALSCFMQAMRCSAAPAPTHGHPHTHVRGKLPVVHTARVFWLLGLDSSKVLLPAFEQGAARVPLWIWLPWIPQLLSSLGRPEAR
jgi:transformation/transcription domain-associated protein